MKLKQLLTDDDAVSPVIGVILMVAITVILAAVIGTFVLGLGDRVSEAQPNAQFGFEYTQHDGKDAINITHDGGEGVNAESLNVSVGGANAWSTEDETGDSDFDVVGGDQYWEGKVTAGDELSLYESSSGDTIEDGMNVQVIWHASGSDKTAIIGESEVSF